MIRLIIPPQFEPFQPYLSLPYLKGLLKKEGIESVCYDANLDFYFWLLDKHRLVSTISSYDKKLHYLTDQIDKAKRCVQSGFEDIDKYRWSLNVLDELFVSVNPEPFELTLSSCRIGNKYFSNDIKHFFLEQNNVFDEFFYEYKAKILLSSNQPVYLFSIVVIDQLGPALSFSKKIKRFQPRARVIFGGPLIAIIYEKLKQLPWIKYFVDELRPEEGYIALSKVLNLPQKSFSHVKPNYSDIIKNKYLSSELVLPYLVSHGCKWGKCLFCSHHKTYSEYHKGNIDLIVKDITELYHKFGVRFISFSDEYIPAEIMLQISSKLKKSGTEIYWSSFARAEKKFTEPETCELLYQAGCRLLFFGFETVSQRLLNLMQKGNQSKYYKTILENCKNAGIAVRLDLMIGIPTETDEEFHDLLNFLKDNKEIIDTPFSSVATAVFEMKDQTPIFNMANDFGLSVNQQLRGDLDEQYDYSSSENDVSNRIAKREEVMLLLKTEFNSEITTPKNKTHQLILKTMFDKGKIRIPQYPVADLEQNVKLNEGVFYFAQKNLLENYANGGAIELNGSIKSIISEAQDDVSLRQLFSQFGNSNKKEFLSIINYLMRNDYLISCTKRVK